MKRALATAVVALLLISCGAPSGGNASRPGATPSVSPGSTASAAPTQTPAARATSTPPATAAPAPPAIRPGDYAYVVVSIATGWRSPGAVRAVDAPALANPARIRDWVNAMTWSQKADLINRADTEALLGDRVLVLAVSGGWADVAMPDQRTPLDARGYPAWMPLVQLSAVAPAATTGVAAVRAPTTWLHGPNGAATTEVSFGTRLPVVADWGSSLQVALPAGATATVQTSAVTAAGTLPATAGSLIESARAFLGLQYLWAGTSGFGYDCSGLVYMVYRMHGVQLPRDADAQATAGSWVARSSLQPGDLVFFGTTASTVHHVAIYVGGNNVLESPQTGTPVRIIPLATYADYYTARHVLP